MKKRTPSIQTINLGYEQLLLIDAGDGSDMRVLHGATWLTGAREPANRVFRAGQRPDLQRSLMAAPTKLDLNPLHALGGWQQALPRLATALRHVRLQPQFGVVGGASPQA